MLPRIVPSVPWIQNGHEGTVVVEPPPLRIAALDPSPYDIWIHPPQRALLSGG